MNESSVTELLVFLLGYITKIVDFLLSDCLKNVIMSKPQMNIENTLCAQYWPYSATGITGVAKSD